ERMTGKHFYKHAVLKLLSGVSVEEMESCANSYAQWLLNNRKVKSVWAILNKRGSAPIILASASLDPVVKALANLLQVSYVASELEQFNGLYTGKYKRDLTGQKDNALIAQYPDLMSGKKICVISDNLTDKNLITEAACPYVVLHNQSHRMRWGDINATFIGLNR
ncbi:MAG: hypothetical protein KAU21_12370, partial [Gammaproteobacteria bacterium]|nr:hypothetical protein [Gammaproteobacteria bacterium]